MIEIYGFSFSLIELIAFGILCVAFFYQLYFYLRYVNGVLRLRSKTNKGKVSFLAEQPPVSVIICAKDEADNLRQFLPFVLQQEYPDFEVIVINDGSTDETEGLLNDLSVEYPNLRTTFVPVGARNLSTKKLGLTLGIKAAKNELLLFTDADCMPEDNTWIARMARNFTPETDFILGYGAYLNKKGFLNRLITYDTLFIALQYMGMALARKPYMGVGRNLAYRKETFFTNKGFASNLKLISGDDDLFVNKASNKNNTKVEIAPDSITWSEPNKSFSSWFYQKERHLSVSSYYKASSKFRLSLEPMTRGLFYLSLILTLVVGNLITMIAGAVLFVARLILQMVIVNKSSTHFGERKYLFTLPVFDIFLPLVSLYILTVGRITSRGKSVRWK
ncbi:MAG: glycosyltransferase [Paludibacter sp.]|nr:glycosyltransferase [Paludibacter sp.]